MDRRLLRFHQRLIAGESLTAAERAVFTLLKVLSVLFEALARGRVFLYRCGLLAVYRSRLPVISVGNLAAGGTGKTPVCDFLVKLAKQHGFKTALISRGYGGHHKGLCQLVSDGERILLDAAICGDEPLLLARRNPEAIVAVARRRKDGLAFLERLGRVDLVILDDGFQHLQVARDLDILLLDASTPFGNGYLLPAGILREPRSALARADLILQTRYRGVSLPAARLSGVKALCCRYRLSRQVRALDGSILPLAQLKKFPVVCFAGVATPESFFHSLRDAGIEPLRCLGFPDHVDYCVDTLGAINDAVAPGMILLTTEKDAVKLKAENFSVPCYVAELELEIENASFLENLFLATIKKKGGTVALKKDLLEILACPKCKGEVQLQTSDQTESLVCASCRLAYPVRDGIPIMLIDEAQVVGT